MYLLKEDYEQIDIYCDESNPDLFTAEKKTENRYLLIGGIKLRKRDRESAKSKINELRKKYDVSGEFKWNKVSKNKLEFYKEIVSLFFSYGNELIFRCIVINTDKINLDIYHEGDAELGFYKFYYQLLNKWICDFKAYSIFTDIKTNRRKNRINELEQVLKNSHILSSIESVQAINSKESSLLQMADVLLGAVSANFNQTLTPNSAKRELIAYIEELLQHDICATNLRERKFNVFKINLKNW
ncbi:MAG: DUF3800 domain-containing protein [Candidatus Cloacimonetes bacterium]|nr:DUF3800 domain-containing protein [Candidatus Cloacimonadota bacterium]